MPKIHLFKIVFIASAFILFTNVSAVTLLGLDRHSWSVVEYDVLKCSCLSSGQCCRGCLCSIHNNLLAKFNSYITPYFYRILTLKKWFSEKKRKFLQFKTHFSIRQELYWRLSIVRCWQIPHIFHIRPPKTRHCFKTRGISSTRDSGWP